MDTIKYLHTDGNGKVYFGLTAEELVAQPFCVKIFGTLERPIAFNERINATTGAIETIPLTQDQIDTEAEKQSILGLLTSLDAGTATTSDAQAAIAYLIRKMTA